MTATTTELSPADPAPDQVEPPADNSWASVTAGAVLVLLGTAWLISLTDLIEVRAAFVLPSLLALVGLALVVGSLRGSHPGLIVLGTFLTIATGFAAVAPAEALRGGLGERMYTVTTADQLESKYELGLGDMELDLSELQLSDSRTVKVMLGAGNLDLTIPDDVPVLITAESGAGEIILFGDKTDGVALEKTYRSPDYDNADTRMHIEIQVGAGSIEVNR